MSRLPTLPRHRIDGRARPIGGRARENAGRARALPPSMGIPSIGVPINVALGDAAFWGLDTAEGTSGSLAEMLGGKARLVDLKNTGTSREIQNANVLHLNGTSNYVTITDSSTFDWTTAASWVVTLKNDDAGISGEETFLSKWNTGQREFALSCNSDEKLLLHFSGNGTSDNQWVSDDAITVNEVQTIVVSYDGSAGLNVYRRTDGGTLETIAGSFTAGSLPSSLHNGTADITIGAINEGGAFFWDGKVSDVRLYNVALTEAQAGTLTSWPDMHETDVTTGLVAHYPCDDVSGDIVQNAVADSDHGTITGTVGSIRVTDAEFYSATRGNWKGFSQARWFDGTSSRITSAAATTSYPITLSAWVLSGTASTAAAVWIGDNSSTNNYHRIGMSSGNAAASSADGGAGVATGGNIADRRWHHLMGVFASATDRRVYVDGALAGSETTSISPTGIDDVTIGRFNDSTPGLYWNGLIADARVYAEDMDADNAEWLATGGSSGTAPSTSPTFHQLYQQEYTSASDTVVDESTNSNHGTPTGTGIVNIPTLAATPANDIRGIAATFAGAVPRGPIVNSPVATTDGTDDEIGATSVGNVTSVSMRIKLLADNQEILTFQDSTATAVTVVAGVLTFGGSITNPTNIQVDGYVRTAAQAGALLNDNGWHLLSWDQDSLSASDFRIGGDSSGFGNLSFSQLQLNGGDLLDCPAVEGDGDTIHDVSGNETHLSVLTGTLSEIWANTGPTDLSIINDGCTLATYYDGSSAYRGTVSSFQPTTSFEITGRARTTGGSQLVVDLRAASGQGCLVQFTAGGNLSVTAEGTTLNSTNTYNDGKWHAFTASWDGATLSLQVDADTADTTAHSSSITASTLVAIASRSFSTAVNFLTGHVRDVGVTIDGTELFDFRDGDGTDHVSDSDLLTATGTPLTVIIPGTLAGPVTHQDKLVEGQTLDEDAARPNSYWGGQIGTGTYTAGDDDGLSDKRFVRTQALGSPTSQPENDDRIIYVVPAATGANKTAIEDYTS